MSAPRLTRWLRGHKVNGQRHEALWTPELDLGDEKVYLSFRDLMEARVAARFVERGLSAQKVRRAINLAREVVGDRPLSTTWLKTDGRAVFLQAATETGSEPKVINLFTRQFAFNAIIERTLRDVEFDGPRPVRWWPFGARLGVVIDPRRSFGQPIEQDTSVPAAALAGAAAAEGSPEAAARAWQVPVRAVRRALRFQKRLEQKAA